MRFRTFDQIVLTTAESVPAAGMLSNVDPPIGEGYVGKTGSNSAAGVPRVLHARVGRQAPATAGGVVLRHRPGGAMTELLGAVAGPPRSSSAPSSRNQH